MAIWALLAVNAGLAVVSALLRSNAKPALPPPLDVPDVEPGDPVPIVFGTCKVPLRVIDYDAASGYHTEDVNEGPRAFYNVVGRRATKAHRYRVNAMGTLICMGPVSELRDVYIGGRSLVRAGVSIVKSGTATITVDLPNFLGGTDVNGGVGGTIHYRSGPGYVSAATPLATVHASYGAPDWRYFAHLVFEDFWLGNSPSLPSLHAVVVRAPNAPFANSLVGSGPVYGTLSDSEDDANPAHILWELWTDPDTGLGRPSDELDQTAFYNLAAALEGGADKHKSFGLSFAVDKRVSAERLIADVCRTADIVLATDTETGKLVPWLIRSAYDHQYGYLNSAGLSGLPHFHPATARTVRWTEPTPASRCTAVRVKFTDRRQDYRTSSVVAENAALSAARGGIVIEDVEFLGLSDERLARRVATRELRALTSPLGRAVITCDRLGAGVMPGRWIRVTWPEHGLADRVLRVTSIDLGTLDDPTVTVEAVDDVYAMPGYEPTRIMTAPWADPIPAAGRAVPIVDAVASPGNRTADVTLTITDPQTRVTLVEWQRLLADGTASGWSTLAGASPYLIAGVELEPDQETAVEWRVSYTDLDGSTQQLTGVVLLPRRRPLLPPVLIASLEANGVECRMPPEDRIATRVYIVGSAGYLPPIPASIKFWATSSNGYPPFTSQTVWDIVRAPDGTAEYVGVLSGPPEVEPILYSFGPSVPGVARFRAVVYAVAEDADGNLSDVATMHVADELDTTNAPLVLWQADPLFPNARVLTAGTNVTLDLSVPGQVIVNAAGGTGAVTTGLLLSPSGSPTLSPSGAPLVASSP